MGKLSAFNFISANSLSVVSLADVQFLLLKIGQINKFIDEQPIMYVHNHTCRTTDVANNRQRNRGMY